MTASDLGISGIAVSTAASATAAIASIDAAISSVNTSRASMGAIQNRLEQTINRARADLREPPGRRVAHP